MCLPILSLSFSVASRYKCINPLFCFRFVCLSVSLFAVTDNAWVKAHDQLKQLPPVSSVQPSTKESASSTDPGPSVPSAGVQQRAGKNSYREETVSASSSTSSLASTQGSHPTVRDVIENALQVIGVQSDSARPGVAASSSSSSVAAADTEVAEKKSDRISAESSSKQPQPAAASGPASQITPSMVSHSIPNPPADIPLPAGHTPPTEGPPAATSPSCLVMTGWADLIPRPINGADLRARHRRHHPEKYPQEQQPVSVPVLQQQLPPQQHQLPPQQQQARPMIQQPQAAPQVLRHPAHQKAVPQPHQPKDFRPRWPEAYNRFTPSASAAPAVLLPRPAPSSKPPVSNNGHRPQATSIPRPHTSVAPPVATVNPLPQGLPARSMSTEHYHARHPEKPHLPVEAMHSAQGHMAASGGPARDGSFYALFGGPHREDVFAAFQPTGREGNARETEAFYPFPGGNKDGGTW